MQENPEIRNKSVTPALGVRLTIDTNAKRRAGAAAVALERAGLLLPENGWVVGELPEEHRLVVTLCDIEGLSYREIAETIERPVGTVMSRLHRARKQLQASLFDVAVERGLVAGETRHPRVVDLNGYRKQGGGQ